MRKLAIYLCIVSLASSALSELPNLKYIGSYKPCWKDLDCKPNAICAGKSPKRPAVCTCEEGYEIYRNSTFYDCFKAMGAGEHCDFEYQCKVRLGELGVCEEDTKTCTCERDVSYVAADGLCYKKRKLDEHCLVDYNCLLANGKHAYCDFSHVCSCGLREKPSMDKMSCVPYRRLGEKCVSDDECDIALNAVCGQVCECQVGYSLSRDETLCLKAATEFGQPCVEDDQCSKFLERSICVNGTCFCQPGYHGYLTNCLKSTELGGACNQDPDCAANGKLAKDMRCKEGICVRMTNPNNGIRIGITYMCYLVFAMMLCIK